MGKEMRRELLEAIRERYRRAAREDKGKILDEFVAVTGHHRKHAIRVLAVATVEAPSPGSHAHGATARRCGRLFWFRGRPPTASAANP
jgi:hypothetical protein